MSTTELPTVFLPELFDLVCQKLTQCDQISLLKSNKSLYNLVLPILYRSITVDCNYSQFEKEYAVCHTTFIKTKAKFMLFLKTLANSDKYPSEKLWILVHEINVFNLPPEFYDFEIIILGNGSGISLFEKFSLLSLDLKSPLGSNTLKQILLDKHSRENLRKLNFTVNKHNTSKLLDELLDLDLQFQNLNTLSIGPFKHDIKLNKILKLIDNKSKVKLQNLKIEACHKTTKLSDLFESSINESKLNISNYVISDLSCLKNLKSLSLCSITFNSNHLMNASGDSIVDPMVFENLKFLELSDVNVTSSSVLVSKSLLDLFYENCDTCNIKYLKLDIRSPLDDTTPKFLSTMIKENQFKELDFTIRHNNMHNITIEKLIDSYINDVILKHRASLEKLSIEIKSERQLIDLEGQLQKRHLFDLLSREYIKLESLRIQVHFDYILQYRELIFDNLQNLRNLWIVGSNAVPIHFGLGNMYPGIYDKWWRIIYLPKKLIDGIETHKNNCLKYIKIDECLFLVNCEESETVQPKNTMDGIFDRLTRVTFDNIK